MEHFSSRPIQLFPGKSHMHYKFTFGLYGNSFGHSFAHFWLGFDPPILLPHCANIDDGCTYLRRRERGPRQLSILKCLKLLIL